MGFVAGISGRVADLGVAGRNGAVLAIEQRNAEGGINGRQVELLVKDDKQNPETAREVVGELLAEDTEVIIGPMTSSIAMAVLPLVNDSLAILVSPTATTTDLVGKDDNFLRVISDTSVYASKCARDQFQKYNSRKVAAIYEQGNLSYTKSWHRDFLSTFEALGGEQVAEIGYVSSDGVAFYEKVQSLLKEKPDLILIITNAVDAALICHQVRKLDKDVGILMSEWSSTERLIELGGAATEGVHVAQFIDRSDTSKRYVAFREAYRRRFGQEPGFAGLAGYDAALVTLEAIASRKSDETLKKAIIRQGEFQGVQQPISINEFGDANRKTFVTVIRDGQYQKGE